MTAPSWRTTPC